MFCSQPHTNYTATIEKWTESLSRHLEANTVKWNYQTSCNKSPTYIYTVQIHSTTLWRQLSRSFVFFFWNLYGIFVIIVVCRWRVFLCHRVCTKRRYFVHYFCNKILINWKCQKVRLTRYSVCSQLSRTVEKFWASESVNQVIDGIM